MHAIVLTMNRRNLKVSYAQVDANQANELERPGSRWSDQSPRGKVRA